MSKPTPLERRTIVRDKDELVPKAKCPRCGQWGDIDPDQFANRTSLICPTCQWHGFIDGREA